MHAGTIFSPLIPTLVAGKTRRVWLIPLWLLLTFNIYWLVWLYTIYQEIRAHWPEATKLTPGKAVGLLFVPFFNIYWGLRVLIDFPRAIARTQRQHETGEETLTGWVITVMMCAAFLFNSLGPFSADPRNVGVALEMALGGETLLMCALMTSQTALNAHWARCGKAPRKAVKRVTLGEVVGADEGRIHWKRAALFVAAFAVASPMNQMLGPSRNEFFGRVLSLPVLHQAGLAACLVVGIRFLRSEWLAAVLLTFLEMLYYGLITNRLPHLPGAFPSLFMNGGKIFFTLALLVVFVRYVRPLWMSLFAATVTTRALLGLFWALLVGERFSEASFLLDLAQGLVFATVIWGGLKLLRFREGEG